MPNDVGSPPRSGADMSEDDTVPCVVLWTDLELAESTLRDSAAERSQWRAIADAR
jgi:hypothetical protein